VLARGFEWYATCATSMFGSLQAFYSPTHSMTAQQATTYYIQLIEKTHSGLLKMVITLIACSAVKIPRMLEKETHAMAV
jgi:hypothetical protein